MESIWPGPPAPTATVPDIYVQCLNGQATVFRNGTPLPLSKKQVALLRYAAQYKARSGIDADTLAALLWPSDDPRRSRHSLRQAISEIGKQAPELNTHIQGGKVVFSRDALGSDVRLFESAVKDDDIDTILALFHGPPQIENLAGEDFSEWEELERDRLQALYAHALKRGIEVSTARANWPEVEKLASALLAVEALDEEAIESRLTAIVLQNEHSRALREANALRIEHHADLSAGCMEFLDRLDAEPDTPWSLRGAGFVGRQHEFQHLVLASKGTSRRAVLLQGSGGIGKTALAHQVMRYAALHGSTCVVVACDRHRRHIPYAGVLDLVHAAPARLVRRLSQEQLDLLKDVALGGIVTHRHAATSTGRSTNDDMVQVFETLLAQSPGAPRMIVFFDDAQHADASSIEVFAEYNNNTDLAGALLLFASRNTDGSAPRLRARFGSTLDVIHLDRLDTATVRTYIASFETRNNLSLSEQDRSALERIAGGEPFYLESLLGSLASTGQVKALRTAGRLAELVQQRLEPLSDYALSVLAVLACAGRSLSLEAITATSALSETAALRAIEELLEARLVEEFGTQITVAHDLIGEAVTSLSTQLRKRLYHARLAGYFSASGPPDHLFLAYQYERAGCPNEAFDHLIEAVANAERFLAVSETEALLDRAIAVAASTEKRNFASRKLAALYLRTSRYRSCVNLANRSQEIGQALEVEHQLARILMDLPAVDDDLIDEGRLQEIVDLTDRVGDHAVQVAALNAFAVHAYGRGDRKLMSALIDQVESRLHKFSHSDQARIWTMIEQLLPLVGHKPKNDQVLGSVQEDPQDWRLQARLITLEARTALLNGRPAKSAELFERAWDVLQQHGAIELFATGMVNYGLALWQKGDLAAAADAFDHGRAFAVQLGDVHEARLCQANLAALRYELGEIDAAREMAEAILAEPGLRLVIHLASSSILGLCALAQGDMSAATAAKTTFDQHHEQMHLLCLGHHPSLFLSQFAHLTEGRAAAIAILDQWIARESARDIPAAMALRLERARLIVETNRDEAIRELELVRALCRARGLHEHDSRMQEITTLLGIHSP